ncbi:MAG: HAMP domain-containing protein [Limnohabitans sp.]|jgi:nitrogen fixation/metabolism regulation signal transduction histidine kinase|nr:HAMP domain-containing protein [Limnohabitans sp.]MBP8021108.1 HAMP domain-containing protein [Limnohabitans sp.]
MMQTTATALRHRSWLLGVVLTILMSLALVLLFLLTQATQRWDVYEQNYSLLFGLNTVFAGLLLLVITWFAWRLISRLRQGKFGSRLLVKLAAIFGLVGILPGLLIYGVSYQFVTRSIEVWFDTKVEVALDAGLNLSRSTLESLANELTASVRSASAGLRGESDSNMPIALEKVREQLDANEVTLWRSNGTVVATVGEARYQLQPERPSASDWRQVRQQGVSWRSEGLDDNSPGMVPRMTVLLKMPGTGFQLDEQQQVLQVVKKLPPVLVANALAVLEANREYQERALARNGLQRMYIGTLTLALFLAVFGAVLLAVLLGNQLAKPLLVLAEGVRDVAAGDLRPKPFLQGKDELDGLTRSFADMTQQLSDARNSVERSMAQVDLARSHLQTMLDNLTAGVILLNRDGEILSINPGATRILQIPMAAHVGKPLQAVEGLEVFGHQVMEQFAEFVGEHQQHSLDHWQQSFELDATLPRDRANDFAAQTVSHTTLVARGALLPQGDWLLVFDDISEIVSAQRTQAWAEVARRLAHEIKNPLTPIQLSAERLAMKLQGKLDAADQTLVTKSVKTIVDQVDALQRLVNEFRDFGRLPQARLQALDMNEMLGEMMPLYDNVNAVVPVRWQLQAGLPPILGDAAQLRQVVHNLIQNAQDACAQSPRAQVEVRTEMRPQSQRVRLSVHDNGSGFSEAVLQRAFEPYVTTKASGTGLGLAVVKKIADEHHARIELKNKLQDELVTGAQVSLSFRLADSQLNLN